jgi:glutamate:Na+ symporter, ESS family
MSLHLAAVAFTYLLSFLVLTGLTALLGLAGKVGMDLATNLWGISFIFASLTASIVRLLVDRLKIGHVLDNDGLSRISGISVDYMVAGSLAAISLVFVGRYWLPLLAISTVGGILITLTVPWFASRIFKDSRYERMIMIYGVSTGTLSTGLALLRILDPEFKTKVSSDYMLAAGLVFALMIPFILAINLPAQAGMTGDMQPFWMMIGISVGYIAFTTFMFVVLAKGKAFRKPASIWLEE